MGIRNVNPKEISTRSAARMRIGIALGELAYNLKVKSDLRAARNIMWKASREPKVVYMAALHTLASRLRKNGQKTVQPKFTDTLDTGEVVML